MAAVTIKNILKNYSEKISSETAVLDCELILSAVLGWSRSDLFLKKDEEIPKNLLPRAQKWLTRRSQGEPVAYIVGYKDFYKSRFIVTPSVLIPRPETELIVENIIDLFNSFIRASRISSQFKILDMGCGSGCLGLSILKEFPKAQLVSIDISDEALQVAQKNAENLGIADRCKWICADISSFDFPSAAAFDLVVANPPYIGKQETKEGLVSAEVMEFEPPTALFAEGNGYDLIFAWSLKASSWLGLKGVYMTEMGCTQGEKIKKFVENQCLFDKIEVVKDYSNKDRFIQAVRGY